MNLISIKIGSYFCNFFIKCSNSYENEHFAIVLFKNILGFLNLEQALKLDKMKKINDLLNYVQK